MTYIDYKKLTEENFNVHSLDEFIRHQEVEECWRNIDGKYVLVSNAFVEDWDLEKRQEIAREVEAGINPKEQGFAYGAFFGKLVVGFIYVSNRTFGSNGQYIELKLLQVSEPFRRMGIGRKLFWLACEEARRQGAKKLYISAHSSRESQAAYRKLGCVEAEEVNREIAEQEPFDVQMEYQL